MRVLVYAIKAVWAAPVTLVGLLLAILGGARPRLTKKRTIGVSTWWWQAEKGPWHWFFDKFDLAAITFGHVIIYHNGPYRGIIIHEHVHVKQIEYLGVFWFVAYPLASLIALIRGERFYRDNWFEKQAYAAQRRGWG